MVQVNINTTDIKGEDVIFKVCKDGDIPEIDIGNGWGFVRTGYKDNFLQPYHAFYHSWGVGESRPDIIIYVRDGANFEDITNALDELRYNYIVE